jgi:hypothetical protein
MSTMWPLRSSQSITGERSTAGSHSMRPVTARVSPPACASAWPRTRSREAGMQSSPMNSTIRPRASRMPRFRAAAAPGTGSATTRAPGSAGAPDEDPLSTTTTSASTGPSSWSRRAARVRARTSHRSRVGITTVTSAMRA